MKKSERTKELRDKDVAGLEKELGELARAHFSLRMQIATQQNTDTAQLRRLRRDMARVRTVMNQKAAQQ